MHIISIKRLKEFWLQHPDAEDSLVRWYKVTRSAQWHSLIDARRDFPHADLVGVCTVFNIKGNAYRLISKIYYPNQVVLVRIVLTHADTTKGVGFMIATVDEDKYGALLAAIRPRVISDDAELERLTAEVNHLVTKGIKEHRLSPEEEKLLALLAQLIENYEQRQVPQLTAN